MYECKSLCTGIVRPYCTIGVNDYLNYECAECRAHFTKKGIEKSLKIRFGSDWQGEWYKLKLLKREIRSFRTKMRRQRLPMAEMVYLNSPLEPASEHEKCDEALPKEFGQDPRMKDFLEKYKGYPVYIYTGKPSHKIRWNR